MGNHTSVLLEETVEFLAVRVGGRYIDGTLGRAGHAKRIIEKGGTVLGIDCDDEALDEVRAMGIAGLKAVKGHHADIARIARENEMENADGILLDLGVSSPQLDEAGRGFSFHRDGPLDMRMDGSLKQDANDIVNGSSEEELAAIFRDFGEEPNAKRIAKAIVRERTEHRPFMTTLSLADFIERTVGRRGAHHPATRVFQALRMFVNSEIAELESALEGGLSILRPGGRFAVITFESLTDRVVKRFFADHAGREISLQQGGSEWRGSVPRVNLTNRRPIVASEDEITINPRSRSAKLRVVERA